MSMSDKKANGLHEYAGGWMTERTGTDLPPFLKFALPVIAFGAVVYFFVYMNGEVTHATRGRLVQQLNAATHFSSGFMYFVAALILVYGIILVRAVFSKPEHEE